MLTISKYAHKYYFWFYFRKALFQIFFPIILALVSFYDWTAQSQTGHVYGHIYFYTSLILCTYAGMKYILEYIFSVCAEDIILKKVISIDQTIEQLIPESRSDMCEHFIIITKKIFKLRYSQYPLFTTITNLCWFLGIDSPILIPHDVVLKISNIKDINTVEDEDVLLHTTLTNLYYYHPRTYEVTLINDGDIAADSIPDIMNDSLVPTRVVTRIDKSICDIQKQIFNKQTEIDMPNV